jgi:hypothetical protein
MNMDGSEKMILAYREYPPSAPLAQYVEGFWSHEAIGSAVQRVLPDEVMYQTREFGVREPGGTVVVFAEFTRHE